MRFWDNMDLNESLLTHFLKTDINSYFFKDAVYIRYTKNAQ